MISMETRTRAAGTFEIDSWSDETYDDGADVKLSKAHLTKIFAGDLIGTSVVDMLAVSIPAEGNNEFQGAAYVATERFTGSVHGRAGGFVLVHTASAPHGMTVAVVPGSASGELAGLTGELAITKHEDGSHTYLARLSGI
jgi:uncharacterized protein DUF3224